MELLELIQNPIVKGALIGLWSAASVDLHSWLRSTGWKAQGFDISIASKRWVTGAIMGALGAAGLGLAA